MTPRALGYRPDTADTRDFSAAEKLGSAPPPPSASARHLVVDVLDQGSMSSCFPAGTPIVMGDFTERPIEDVAEGNDVRTHDGRLRRVTKKFERAYEGRLFTLHIKGYAYPVTMTPEHPIAVIPNLDTRRAQFNFGPLKWVQAKDLAPRDFVLIPANTAGQEEGCPHTLDVLDYITGQVWYDDQRVRIAGGRITHTIPRHVEVNETLARLVGLFLAEGCIVKHDGQRVGINFTFARHEKLYHDFVVKALRACFGVEANLKESEQRPSVTDIACANATLARFLYGFCGELALAKYVPRIFFAAPRDVRIALLRGWLEGDGTQKQIHYTGGEGSSVMAIGVTSSEQLHRGLLRLALLSGMKPGVQIRAQEVHQNLPARSLGFYSRDVFEIYPEAAKEAQEAGVHPDGSTNYRRHDLGFLCRIKSIEISETEEPIQVYNLEVEGEHTYVANNIAVHNCVANAIMQAVRASHVQQGVANPKLGSRLFAYYCSRAFHHETNVDGGTYLRTCFQGMNKFGVAPEDIFPYTDAWKKLPPTAAFRAAYDQISPTRYERIVTVGSARVDDIKRAIAAGHLVCFGTDIASDFFGDKGEEPILPPVGKEIAGGHAMTFAGYDGDVFDVVNSWGTGWGKDGWCKFSAEYAAWDGTRDIWICAHSPRYSA